MLGLYVDAELGEYFKGSMGWHNRSGPVGKWSRFCMQEMHDLYLKFELPWWNEAGPNPANKSIFSATVRSQKLVIVPKS